MLWVGLRAKRRVITLGLLLVGLTTDVKLFAQQEKRPSVRGSDVTHPLYWPLGKKSSVEGIGDKSSRPAIVYIIRLKAGQQLVANMTAKYDKSLLPEPFVLYLFDGKTTSLMGSGTNWLIRANAQQSAIKNPTSFTASLKFESPVSADYFVVPVFQGAGFSFRLDGKASMVESGIEHLSCASGSITKVAYISNGADSLISDVTIGDPAKVKTSDQHNRRFCLKQACTVRPPTSLVLTYELQDASDAKRSVKVCWSSDDKEISEVE